ncbi:peroxin Pex32 [Schizosaccharomyces cryophilus OY26]|uniref:Peroxin Pex32 n=1 Tax=Schizosaccharomyces cryophilus (strain OY26 / ATCC MYA-4695 / CBS 11777 / NBRC 106824 / NRRL Y48691) TaxID=653667 RepID=S9VWH3_SCHCR|nr:peroxin Pex32 [Schizosaccharomyces cryophilus OY26]EPY50599.1 peroxin Pex32 [Schizosaccharomyces cryophilus OY26]
MSAIQAHLLSEKNSSQSTVRSTGSELLDILLKICLWIAPWYACLSTLFFTWLIILYPRPTLACSVSAWLFWFTSMRKLKDEESRKDSSSKESEESKKASDETGSESARSTTESDEQAVHVDSDFEEEEPSKLIPGLHLLQGRWAHGKAATTGAEDLHTTSDLLSHKAKKKPQRSDSIGQEVQEGKAPLGEDYLHKIGRLSISKIVTDHLIRKEDYPVETSQKINKGPIFVNSSTGPTLLDAYLEPVHHLYQYSLESNTLFFSYLPFLTAAFIFCLPTQAVFIFFSTIVLAWHSPPMKAVLLAISRISIFSSLSEKFVFGKIEVREEEDETLLNEPTSVPGDVSDKEPKDTATSTLLKALKKSAVPSKKEITSTESNGNENSTEKYLYLIEHQRYWVGVGWLNRTLPTDHPNFTSLDRNIPVAEPTAQLLPPDGIAWIDDKWSIGPWTYTDTFWRQPSLTQYRTAFTRFREWRRRYRILPEESVHSVPEPLSSEKGLDDEQVVDLNNTNSTSATTKPQSKTEVI